MEWKPATKDEVLAAIAETAADCGPERWPHYEQMLCDPYVASIDRFDRTDQVWIVARLEHRVVFFEDIEDNFVTATELDGKLIDCADYVDLRVALREAALGH